MHTGYIACGRYGFAMSIQFWNKVRVQDVTKTFERCTGSVALQACQSCYNDCELLLMSRCFALINFFKKKQKMIQLLTGPHRTTQD